MVSQQGFEPQLNGPKPFVLPLDDRELWCSVMDSNQRLPLCKGGILSTELTEHMVEVRRVELLSAVSVQPQLYMLLDYLF